MDFSTFSFPDRTLLVKTKNMKEEDVVFYCNSNLVRRNYHIRNYIVEERRNGLSHGILNIEKFCSETVYVLMELIHNSDFSDDCVDERLFDVTSAAKFYRFDDLEVKCYRRVRANISMKNVFKTFIFARKYQCFFSLSGFLVGRIINDCLRFILE